MTLRQLMAAALRDALVAELPAIRARDVHPSSTLYDKPRTARGVSPAHFELPRTLTTLRALFRETSDRTLGRLGARAGGLRRLEATADAEVWGTVSELSRWLTELAASHLRVIARQTGARGSGLAADSPGRSRLDNSSSAEREQRVRGVQRELQRLVDAEAGRLSSSEASQVRRAETIGALIPVIARKLERFLTN